MRIPAINTKTSQLKSSFTDKLLLHENLSDISKSLSDQIKKPIVAVLAPTPNDLFIKELPLNGKEEVIIALIDPLKNNKELSLDMLIKNFNEKFNKEIDFKKIQEEFESLINTSKDKIDNICQNKTTRKQYVPTKIGKPQKAFIDKRHTAYRKK